MLITSIKYLNQKYLVHQITTINYLSEKHHSLETISHALQNVTCLNHFHRHNTTSLITFDKKWASHFREPVFANLMVRPGHLTPHGRDDLSEA